MMNIVRDVAPGDLVKSVRSLLTTANRVTPSNAQRDSAEVPLCVPSDAFCPYHCVAAGQNVVKWEGLELDDKISLTKQVKNEFLVYLRARDKLDVADRLSLDGKEGYLGLGGITITLNRRALVNICTYTCSVPRSWNPKI